MMDKGQGQKWTGWTRWTRMDYGRDKGQGTEMDRMDTMDKNGLRKGQWTRDMGQGTWDKGHGTRDMGQAIRPCLVLFTTIAKNLLFVKDFQKKTMRKLLALKIFLIFEKVFEPPGRFHSFSWTVAKTGNERLIGDVGISPER